VKATKRVLVVVSGALFLDMLVYGLVVPVVPVYSARLGGSAGAIGLLFASYGVALLAASPVIGAGSAHVRRRTLLLLGLAGLAASTLLFAEATTFAALVGARLLPGMSAAASWTAGLALLADTTAPEHRGRAFGVVSMASALGTLLGPPLGGWLADGWGYRAPFHVVTGLAALATLSGALALGRHEPPRAAPRARPSAVLADRHVRAIGAFVVLAAALLGLIEPTLPLELSTRLHASSRTIGLLFAATTIVYGLVSPLVGWAADKMGAFGPIRLGWLGLAFAAPLLTMPASLAPQVAVMAFLGVALAMTQGPSLRALATAVERVGGDYGVAYAGFNAAYAVGIMLGAGLGGPLVDALGPSRGFSLAAALLLLGGIVPAFALSNRVAPGEIAQTSLQR
jgi:MFS transporter, DHA1 family, solute carrier family 18 (vesicular amine transporter), member 1/2